MVDEVKCCPFCGDTASLDHMEGKFWVQCDDLEDCGVTDGIEYDSPDEAVRRWNRRA